MDELVHEHLAAAFAPGAKRGESTLSSALRYLAKWRQAHLDAVIAQASGGKVLSGPFEGMVFALRGTHGSLAPKLTGTYEHELHKVIETIVSGGYEAVLNIGAAEGYYAVGLARRMPATRVFAYDTDERARTVCAAVGNANDVSARLLVEGLFRPEDFAAFAGQRTVVICDIEGHERDLLKIEQSPALAQFDILVECHDTFVPGLADEIARRFAPTHVIERIERARDLPRLPSSLSFRDELDTLIALWEWRTGPTPWLWMRARRVG